MLICFHPKNGWYVTRVGDIEFRLLYDATSWHINWVRFGLANACTAEWWCARHDCDLDELGKRHMADDDYCFQCPRRMTETEDEDSYTSNGWSENPANLEEARKLILERYRDTLEMYDDNPFHQSSENIWRIMRGTWLLSPFD